MACMETGWTRTSVEMRNHSKSIEVSFVLVPAGICIALCLSLDILAGNEKKFTKLMQYYRIEEELRHLTDTADGEGTTKRKSARRSFFRRKKHQRSSSRDSKDLSSFSSTQLSWFTDSGILGEDGTLSSYQRVERLDCELKWFEFNKLVTYFDMIFHLQTCAVQY